MSILLYDILLSIVADSSLKRFATSMFHVSSSEDENLKRLIADCSKNMDGELSDKYLIFV